MINNTKEELAIASFTQDILLSNGSGLAKRLELLLKHNKTLNLNLSSLNMQ